MVLIGGLPQEHAFDKHAALLLGGIFTAILLLLVEIPGRMMWRERKENQTSQPADAKGKGE